MSWANDVQFIPTRIMVEELIKRGAKSIECCGDVTININTEGKFKKVLTIDDNMEDE